MHILKKINQNLVYDYQSIDIALKKMEISKIKVLFVINKKKNQLVQLLMEILEDSLLRIKFLKEL